VWARHAGTEPAWTQVLYLAASKICHQRPERSFCTGGIQWPVCGRCSGLYLAAPVGAFVALSGRRRERWSARRVVLVAAAPTLLTIAAEWAAVVPVTSLVRALAAAPLGAAIAFALVSATKPEVH
jgi:uncharacterized membrane protein